MPATPVLSNGGTGRGLPICCFLNSVSDSLEGIVGIWNENVWLASKGGGIGTYWGNLRGIGEKVGLNGKTSGIIPFIRVMDSLTLAISQGSLRRGSAACYLDINHPEIEEFLEIRKPTGRLQPQGAEPAPRHARLRRVHARGARRTRSSTLQSPKDGSVRGKVDARCAVPEAGRDPPRDRRAVHDLHRPREPGDARSITATSASRSRPPTCAPRSRCRPAATSTAPTAPRCAASAR